MAKVEGSERQRSQSEHWNEGEAEREGKAEVSLGSAKPAAL